jgi:hypothetical protein
MQNIIVILRFKVHWTLRVTARAEECGALVIFLFKLQTSKRTVASLQWSEYIPVWTEWGTHGAPLIEI